jgi:tetratricopeptide (TPR) repeat protein
LVTPVAVAVPNIQEAIALHQHGQFGQAEEIYRQLLEIDPRKADALHLLGMIAHQTGHYQGAVDLIGDAIAVNPNVSSFHSNRGLALQELKQLDAAVASYDKAIALEPDYAEAYYNRGNALQELKQLDAAVASYDKAIALKPDYAEAYSNRGLALQELKQLDAAVYSYDKAIAFKLEFAKAYYNRGNALNELKQLDAAVYSYDKAIALKPDFAEAYSNRGIALKELKQLDDAIASYDKAIALKPDYAEAYYNRGTALQELKQLDAAVASCDKAIVLAPDFAEAYWNKSMLLLLTREFVKGFNLYEWRWDEKNTMKWKRNFSQPLWLGEESLSDKTILIHAEQGLGDTIQFCRYIKMVSDLDAKVIFEVQKPLVRLLKDLPGVSTLIAKGDPLPEFDFHCPLLSLPLAFKTDLNSIPSARSYLEAEVVRIAYWKDRIKGDGLKIGIAWQGSKGTTVDIGRSFELKLFEKIATQPNVHLISLQKGYGSEQLKNMPQGMQVMDLGEELDADGAFLDSAAVIINLDLVISSDTALAHLAGALGIKTWVALKYVPDWRWMLDRQDSPWYPSLKLYRQEKMDDWSTVFDQMQMDIISMSEAI